jgi:4-hydroxybenzoate polyprenyltransferase
MYSIKKYLSLVKFSHTIFAMPFAFIGFFLGIVHRQAFYLNMPENNTNVAIQHTYFTHQYIAEKFVLVIICMVTARNAAMAFNRYLDRHFDARNPRTAIREIPKGIILPESALRFVLINCLLFLLTTYFINKICFYLAPIALFVVLFYSYTKRFTALCHLVLGIGLSLAPIGAYLAVTGVFGLLPVLFSFAVIFWVSGFDVIYALQDVDFDQSQKLYSIPAVFGKINALRISSFLHFLSAVCVILAGYYGNFHALYWIGILIFTGMLLYQHSIVKPNDLSRVNIAFMTANGIASVVFSAFVIADLFIF